MPVMSVGMPSSSATPNIFNWLHNIFLLGCHSIRWHRWFSIIKICSASVALDRALRGFPDAMLVSHVQWTCSALWRFCGSDGPSLSRFTWRRTWQMHTEMSASASATNPLYMNSTSCTYPSITFIQAILSSTYPPRWWKLYTWTGVRRLLEGIRMARIRWQGDIKAWSRGYSVWPNPGSCKSGAAPTSSTWVYICSTWPSLTHFTRRLHWLYHISVGRKTSSRTNGYSALSFVTRAGSIW